MAAKKGAIMAGKKGPVLRLRYGRRRAHGIREEQPLDYLSACLSSDTLVFGAR